MASLVVLPVDHTDPINAQILAISEDRIRGYSPEPFAEIAERSGLPEAVVLERIRAMLAAGTIRRVRQTLVATRLTHGALVAWRVPEERLNTAFDFLFERDPFSGHVVVRSTDTQSAGAEYRLWTTLKVPPGVSMERHAELLMRHTGCERFKLMPARGIFTLGVGHVRRSTVAPGAKSPAPAAMLPTGAVSLNELEWRVVMALKREFGLDEIAPSPWRNRAEKAGIPPATFHEVARSLEARKVLGRFSTFLEHAKPLRSGRRVTRFNALFHWAVPAGREAEAGGEIGRHEILTHCYWREGGPEFGGVNIMAVAHGTEREPLLAHKAAIDSHLSAIGIPVGYTNVFWGGRSEIKPSEITPQAYREWITQWGWNGPPRKARDCP